MKCAKVNIRNTYFYVPSEDLLSFLESVLKYKIIEDVWSSVPKLEYAYPEVAWIDAISDAPLTQREITLQKDLDTRSAWWMKETARADSLQKELDDIHNQKEAS